MSAWDGFAGSALGAGASLLGTVANSALSISAAQRNQRYAREQMQFQEEMSNTAHQREVEDLKKAGLNPLYSAMGMGGASTPAGQSGSIAQAVGEGIDVASAKDLLKYFDSQKDNIDADTDVKNEEVKNAPIIRKRAEAEGRKMDADAEALEIENKWNKDHPTWYSLKQSLPVVGQVVSALGQGVGGIFKGMMAVNSAKSVANDTARTMILANKYADSKSKSGKK